MKIVSIKLRNFKSFRDVEFTNIPSFCVIVGANGSGKTTLFDVFGFLKDCLVSNVKKAIQIRGGFDELISREAEERVISIEIKYRMPIANVNRLVTYALEITQEQNQPYVQREILKYKRGQHGSPFHFLDFARGAGFAISNEEDFNKKDEDLERDHQHLSAPELLAIKGLGQIQRFKAANAFRQLIENWHVSDFHITSARGSKDAIGFDEQLSVSGDNLQHVARNMLENHRDEFNKILDVMKSRIPGVMDVEPVETQDGRLLLSFKDGAFKDPFIDKYVSDGTIKMFAYLVLLYDPNPHPLLCVEEPENQLYPSLLEELAEEFRAYAIRGGQVFVSTHSPDFLNAAELDEVFWLYKQQGYTKIERASNDDQITAYMKDGDKMGNLWKQGFFKAADPR